MDFSLPCWEMKWTEIMADSWCTWADVTWASTLFTCLRLHCAECFTNTSLLIKDHWPLNQKFSTMVFPVVPVSRFQSWFSCQVAFRIIANPSSVFYRFQRIYWCLSFSQFKFLFPFLSSCNPLWCLWSKLSTGVSVLTTLCRLKSL